MHCSVLIQWKTYCCLKSWGKLVRNLYPFQALRTYFTYQFICFFYETWSEKFNQNIKYENVTDTTSNKGKPTALPFWIFLLQKREIAKGTVVCTVRSVYRQVCHNYHCKELFKLHLGSGECDFCCNSLGLQRTSCTFNTRSSTWWLPDAQKRKPLRWW